MLITALLIQNYTNLNTAPIVVKIWMLSGKFWCEVKQSDLVIQKTQNETFSRTINFSRYSPYTISIAWTTISRIDPQYFIKLHILLHLDMNYETPWHKLVLNMFLCKSSSRLLLCAFLWFLNQELMHNISLNFIFFCTSIWTKKHLDISWCWIGFYVNRLTGGFDF